MRRISKLAVFAGMASLLAVGAPAAAMAHTGRPALEPPGFKMDSCTGTEFGDASFESAAAPGYFLAKSTRDTNLVLVNATAQRFDGYADPSGHLIIYICGTNLVFTDNPKGDCFKGFSACVYLENYTDSRDQWWTRVYNGDDQENIVSKARPKSWTITDPGSRAANGTNQALSVLRHGLKSQLYAFKD
jgi:hypothetical protein